MLAETTLVVVAMDDNVGNILATIENFGLNDDTIVVFTNDNGGPGGKTRLATTLCEATRLPL